MIARDIFVDKYAGRDENGNVLPEQEWPKNITPGKLKELTGKFIDDIQNLVPMPEKLDPRKFAENLSALTSRSKTVSG